MSGIAKKAGLKVFEKHLDNYTPADPLYEEYTDDRGRKRRRKACPPCSRVYVHRLTSTQRELPPGLSKRDAAILRKVKSRAHYLDKGFSVCGLRFGWTFIIGIIPMAGDIADASLNYFLVVRKARQAEIPGWLLRKMLANNAVSAGVGFIPVVGDIILATYKANSRNAALLEEFLRIRGEEFLKAEAARNEDEAVIKPGAGREQGETIPGKKTGTIKSLFTGQPKAGSSSALVNTNTNAK